MKKGTILLLFAVILLAATNPSKSEYVEWAKEKMLQGSDNILEQGAAYLVGMAIDPATNSEDYLLFTVFQTQGLDSTLTTIGVLGFFVPLGDMEEWGSGGSTSTTDFSEYVRLVLILGAVYFVFIKPLRRKYENKHLGENEDREDSSNSL